ncbi:MAG: PAS domain S-box protein [Candidatus Omnitrophica bacterium]|nr:PAS domain S-box protein [Candidatus Omnitrophota bacterium]MBD3268878.1 PAS domain S-box protein [Candidatus Omnitrophota bacterium]
MMFKKRKAKEAKPEPAKSPEELEAEVQKLRNQLAELTVAKRQCDWSEERLKEENLQIQKYLDVAKVIILALDTTGKVILINKTGCEILGHEQNAVLGKNWLDNFIPEGHREEVKELFAKIVRDNRFEKDLEYHENPIITKGKGERYISWHNAFIRDENNRISLILSSGEDITERKRGYEQRLRSLEFYHSLVRAMPEAVLLVSPEGKVIMANTSAAGLYGYERSSQIIGESVFENFKPTGLHTIQKDLFKALRGESVKVSPYTLIDGNGETKFVEVSFSSVKDISGEAEAVILVVRDVSKQEENKRRVVASEERFRQVCENAKEWIWEIDTNGTIVYSSIALNNFCPFPLEEVVGKKKFVDLFHSDCRRQQEEIFNNFFNERKNFHEFIHCNKGKDGEERWFSTGGLPFWCKGGKFCGYRGVSSDITTIKKAEEELKFLGSITQQVSDAIIVTNNNFNITYLNQAALDMYGYDMRELLGKRPGVLNAEPVAARIQKEIYETVSQGGVWEGNHLNRRKDGSIFICHFNICPLYNDKGEIYSYISIQRDITNKKKAEEYLEKSQARYQAIVEGQNDFISRFDKAGKITFLNRAYCKFLGRRREDLAGSNFFELIPSEEREKIEESIKKLDSGNPNFSYEYKFITDSGKSCWQRWTVRAIFAENERVIEYQGVGRDITSYRETESALKDSEEKYRLLVDYIPICLATFDKNGKFIIWNKYFENVLGYSGDDIPTRLNFKDIYEAEDVDEILDESARRGIYNQEALFLKKNKETVPVRLILVPQKDCNDNLCSFYLFAEDISEKKTTERKLLFTQFVFDRMQDAAFWLTSNGRISYVNYSVENLLGYSRDELLSMSIWDIDVNFHKDNWEERWNKVKNKKRASSESIYRAKDGTLFPVEISGNYIEYGDREYLCVIVRDVTERERIEEALRRSEREKAKILNSLSELVIYHDPKMRVLWANQAAGKAAGMAPEELVGNHCYEVWHKRGAACKNCPVEKTLKTGEVAEGEIVTALGRAWAVRSYPTKNSLGQITGVVEVALDMTERKRVEEEYKLSVKKAKRILEETVVALAATAERRDPYTAGHQKRVAQLACAIAKEMNLPKDQIEGIRMASIIHDVGKVYVPAEILSKPQRLTDLEFNIIQTHPQIGYEILKPVEFSWPVAKIVLQHHERLDGSGYPEGIKGDNILFETKILTVADVVEAMAFHRPYRAALGTEKALEEISLNKGILYDEQVVEVCLDLFHNKKFEFEEHI